MGEPAQENLPPDVARGLDTNVLARYLVGDDAAQQEAAREHIEDVCTPKRPGLVHPVMVCELVWVLRSAYDASAEEIAEALDLLLRVRSACSTRPPSEPRWRCTGRTRAWTSPMLTYMWPTRRLGRRGLLPSTDERPDSRVRSSSVRRTGKTTTVRNGSHAGTAASPIDPRKSSLDIQSVQADAPQRTTRRQGGSGGMRRKSRPLKVTSSAARAFSAARTWRAS